MRFMLLIYGSEADAASMTQEEQDALMQGHAAFAQEALAREILTGGAPLQPTRTATTVRVRRGKMPKGLTRLLSPMITSTMKGEVATLSNLKAYLESREV